jgi:leader peptidase (prepilin peptidase)/N-methyltransferase
LQKGKCASCGKEISIQYPIVEVLTGFVWVISFAYFTPLYGAMVAVFSSILIALAWIDIQIMMIPLSLIISGLILIIVGIMVGIFNWQTVFWGGLTGVLFPLAMMGLTYLFTKRQGMGWGDVQLGFILGAWLGPLRMMLTLFIAATLGLLVWVGISLFKGFDKDRPLPFAPYLVIGAVAMMFLGSYVGLILDKFLLL